MKYILWVYAFSIKMYINYTWISIFNTKNKNINLVKKNLRKINCLTGELGLKKIKMIRDI